MNKYKEQKPEKIIQDSVSNIPELLQYFLNRVQFDSKTHFILGLRSVKSLEGHENSWTFKVSGFKGIYGLYFDDSVQKNDWLTGYFGIAYFPHPDEKLIDRFSLAAAYQAQENEYFKKIDEFIDHSEMLSLFEIGRFSLAFNHDETALMLSLYALSRLKVVTIEGVASTQNDPPSFIIEPNGNDMNLPCFVIAYGLFKVLAATVTFSIQRPPDFLRRNKRRGNHFSYTHDSYHNVIPTSWINEIDLHLGYGNADFKKQVETYAEELPEKLETVSWKTGEAYPEFTKNALWWSAHQIVDLQA